VTYAFPDHAAEERKLKLERRTKIIIAIIGGVALIGAAFVSKYFSKTPMPKLDDKYQYTGMIESEDDGSRIKDALVLIIEDQNSPEEQRSDSEGVFHTRISATTQSLELFVVATGFERYKAVSKPNRTGVHEIVLKPIKSKKVASVPKPNHPYIKQVVVFSPSTIPDTPTEKLSNSTLKALASNVAAQMNGKWGDFQRADQSCGDRTAMSRTPKDAEVVHAQCEEQRKEFSASNVGLVSDANFLLNAMRPRLGPLTDDDKNFRFTGIGPDGSDILHRFADRLGN